METYDELQQQLPVLGVPITGSYGGSMRGPCFGWKQFSNSKVL